MEELQIWYGKQVGKTFNMAPLQVITSKEKYLNIRCGPNPSENCIKNSTKFEDNNLPNYMSEAIHDGSPVWYGQEILLVFAAGAGGYAGGNRFPGDSGFAIVGDWVLEPLSGKANEWGIPCKYSDGWQCKGNVPKGTPAHELGHAFGLNHPPAGSKSIMADHSLYPDTGFLPSELLTLKSSPFFTNSSDALRLQSPVPSQNTTAECPLGTVRKECIGYASNNINTYCWGENNKYLGGLCSSKCVDSNKCGITPTPIPASGFSQDCEEGQRRECIGYSSNKINAYCWKNFTYIKGVCNKDCINFDECK